jgi:hypothetical protein
MKVLDFINSILFHSYQISKVSPKNYFVPQIQLPLYLTSIFLLNIFLISIKL